MPALLTRMSIAAVGVADLSDHRLDLRLVGDVADDAERSAATGPDPVGALLGVVWYEIHADDSGALVGQAPGDTAADVRAGAGDDGDLSRELHVGHPPRLTRLRSRRRPRLLLKIPDGDAFERYLVGVQAVGVAIVEGSMAATEMLGDHEAAPLDDLGIGGRELLG